MAARTKSSKNTPSSSSTQPAAKPAKSKKNGAGKKAKADVLNDVTNKDINALLAAAAAIQGFYVFSELKKKH